MKKRNLMIFIFFFVGCKSFFEEKRILEHSKILSSDAFLGRAPGALGEGEIKTVHYLIEEMKKLSFSPVGESWTQKVPIRESKMASPVQVFVSMKGHKNKKTLEQGKEIAIRPSLSGLKKIDYKNIPIVFVGYGIQAKEKNWDDYKGLDLKGKIALVLVNDPDHLAKDEEGPFEGRTMTYYGRWTYKYEQMARLGALGTMIIHETQAASYGWETVKNSNTQINMDIIEENEGLNTKNPKHAPLESWITTEFAKELFQANNLDYQASLQLAQERNFRPIEMKNTTLDVAFEVEFKTLETHNVIGIKKGTLYPEEHIIYSAHWDHLGVRPRAPTLVTPPISAPASEEIYSGAVDNALGVSTVLELGRAFSLDKPTERSIIMMFFAAEEKGLLGSFYYANHPLLDLKKTIAVLNLDCWAPIGIARDFSLMGDIQQDLLDQLIAKAKTKNVRYTKDPRASAGTAYRSDHFPFQKKNIPAISWASGIDLLGGGMGMKEGERRQQLYIEKKYHQVGDKVDASWDLKGVARDLEILYEVGRDLANSRTVLYYK